MLENKVKIILFGILLLSLPLFFLGGPDAYSPRSYRLAWNLGHILFFSIANYFILCSQYIKTKNFNQHLFLVLGFTFIVGIVIELLQGGVSRSPDVYDIARNFLGALIAIFWFSPAISSLNKVVLICIKTIISVVFLSQLYYPLKAFDDEWKASENFPMLADFEAKAELGRWGGNSKKSLSTEYVASGNSSMKVELGTEQYSGISLNYFPSNWLGYEQLLFEIYHQDQAPLKMTVRIHDQQHNSGEQLYSDRYNQSYQLKHGWNVISISLAEVSQAPKTRIMDMTSVAGVGLFVMNEKIGKTVFLDHVRLK